MKMLLLRPVIVVLIASISASSALSVPSDPYYVAGVLEFPALPSHAAPEIAHQRLSKISQLVETADTQPDIVILPAGVLNNHSSAVIIPDPREKIAPCDETHLDYIITQISCYARHFRIYFVINVAEVAADGQQTSNASCSTYSTNAVFDRSGALVSRYRIESVCNATDRLTDQEPTFMSDFNVTFAHFTAMHLLYYDPAHRLVRDGISDFIYASEWASELPFLSAMSLHQAWAYQNDVNLLVAGRNDRQRGETGTGIYVGRYGAQIAVMTVDPTKEQLLVTVVPKKSYVVPGNKSHEPRLSSVAQFTDRLAAITLARNNDTDFYTTYPLEELHGNVSASEVQHEVCHLDLCCTFRIKLHAIENVTEPEAGVTYNSYRYRLAAYKGRGDFLNTQTDMVGVCALLACVSEDLYSCACIYPEGRVVENRFWFETIEISGNFSHNTTNMLPLPISVDGMLQPLNVDAFAWSIQQMGNSSIVSHMLLKPKADLLTFGIYANYFMHAANSDSTGRDAAGQHQACWQATALLLFIVSIIRSWC